jgi:hypothetical protein
VVDVLYCRAELVLVSLGLAAELGAAAGEHGTDQDPVLVEEPYDRSSGRRPTNEINHLARQTVAQNLC